MGDLGFGETGGDGNGVPRSPPLKGGAKEPLIPFKREPF